MGEQGQQFGQEVRQAGQQHPVPDATCCRPASPTCRSSPAASRRPRRTWTTPGAINTNWDQQFKAWAAGERQQGQHGAAAPVAGKLGGAVIASDERIKDNIKQVGKTQDGLPIYEFSIGDGEMQTGVMAQDVEKVDPSAVVQDPATGIKGVNYDQAVGDGTGTYTVEKGDNIWKHRRAARRRPAGHHRRQPRHPEPRLHRSRPAAGGAGDGGARTGGDPDERFAGCRGSDRHPRRRQRSGGPRRPRHDASRRRHASRSHGRAGQRPARGARAGESRRSRPRPWRN